MVFSKQHINDDLLAVGGWADEKASNQLLTTRPQQRHSERHPVDAPTEPHHRGSRPHRVGHTSSNRQNHHSQPSGSEDELLERPPRDVIKALRAAQMIRRQHPACFVKAEGGQRGNEAAAKPSTSLSKMERGLRKRASSAAYLLLEGHDGMESSNPTLDNKNVF
ncbi:hypothetical protein GGR51DRAFT_352155 [Nemania sp. FL0031]|nr:hypothetical protein GGR51DRAFT_352155 [Nemania sp. FL0031]